MVSMDRMDTMPTVASTDTPAQARSTHSMTPSMRSCDVRAMFAVPSDGPRARPGGQV